MRGLPSLSQSLVIVAPHTTFVACIWITPGTQAPFCIAAYKQYVCTHFQIGRGIIFNPTWLQQCIGDFLQHYFLQDAYIAFIPDRMSVLHDFIVLDQINPAVTPQAIPYVRHIQTGYDYLYTYEHKHMHYWYQIPSTLLMQYQCIAVASQLNCIRITPRFCALLYAYKALQGAIFRRTQLALDLMRVHNRISDYFNPDSVRRLVTGVHPLIYRDTRAMIDIIAACGVAYLHQEHTT